MAMAKLLNGSGKLRAIKQLHEQKETSSARKVVGILMKVRSGGLWMVVLCLIVICALPPASRAQVPVYEVAPVEAPSNLVSILRSPSKVASTNGTQA
jgi:hypothetical protein